MTCGVSTSCFYPMETIKSLQTLQNAQIDNVEIFLNTFSELEDDYMNALRTCLMKNNTQVVSLHPFTSSMETFFFASLYETRVTDGLQLYRRYFDACRKLGAKRFVFHGDYKQTSFSFRQHCKNYSLLRKTAAEYGVEFCQENVVRCKCGTPDYIRRMREYTQDDVSFVLDVKQMRRANVSLNDMLDAMQNKISHVHISDESTVSDCVVPGQGNFDFDTLFSRLQKDGFAGDFIIELYRGNFNGIEDLTQGCAFLNQKITAHMR